MHALGGRSHSSESKYKQVPLNSESDSDDDKTLLYAVSSLNDRTSSQPLKKSHLDASSLGDLDIHNPSEDLRFRQRSPDKMRRRKGLCGCARKLVRRGVVIACMMLAIAAVLLFLVLINHGRLLSSSASSSSHLPAPTCSSVPQPLEDSNGKPCISPSPPITTTSENRVTPPPVMSEGIEKSGSSVGNNPPSESKQDMGTSNSPSVEASSPISPSIDEGGSTAEVLHQEEVGTEQLSIVTTPSPNSESAVSSEANPQSEISTTSSLTSEEAATDTITVPVTPYSQITPPSAQATPQATPQAPPIQITPPTLPSQALPPKPLHWEQLKQPSTTESSPQLFDFNKDGFPEVVVVEEPSPCTSDVLALDGRSGSEVWRANVTFPAFAVRCILDVNNDGHLDCLVSGRKSGFTALDSRDGSVLWSVDQSISIPAYNFYFPLVVGDLDGDGGQDLVNIHGGDPSYNSKQLDRSPAFFVAISGRTGESLMEPMQMPDGRESYSSPILFTQVPTDAEENLSNQFIMFGSGGETIPGSLWAIQLKSLRERILSHHTKQKGDKQYAIHKEIFDACQILKDEDKIKPIFISSLYNLSRTVDMTPTGIPCPALGSEVHAIWNSHGVCLYEVVRSESKGVILPPTMVDLNLDGQLDLVVSTFDGRTLALDGGDLSSVIWEVNYPGTESYSIPAPLYYTEDDIPDLVIRTNIGAWPDYVISTIRVIDGSNGSLLWSFNSTLSGLLSSISVVSKEHGRDALIFLSREKFDEWERGRVKKKSRPFNTKLNDPGESERVARHGSMAGDSDSLWNFTPEGPVPDPSNLTAVLEYCGWSQSFYVASLYMVNREMMESGMEVRPLAFYKPFIQIEAKSEAPPHTTGQIEANTIHKRRTSHDQSHPQLQCGRISTPSNLFTTPLLGDLDRDGQLDLVHIVAWSSALEPHRTLVAASNLERLFEGAYGKGILDFDTFLPPSEQPWTQYMGRNGENIFTLSSQP